MRTKQLKIMLSVIGFFLCILFTSCSKDGGDEIVWNLSTGDGVATKDGYFMTDYTSPKMLFYDYKTKETVPLCNKPNCLHDRKSNPDCDAYITSNELEFGKAEFIVHGDYIYYFVPSSFTQTDIIRANIDNSGQMKIADDEISTVYGLVAINHKIYYSGHLDLYDEDGEEIIGQIMTIRCLDLETNSVSVLLNKEKNPDKKIFFEGADRNNLFFLEMNVKSNTNDDTMTTECLRAEYKKISLETMEETTIRDAMDVIYDYYDTSGAYFTTQKGEEKYEVCQIDYDTGEVHALFQTDSEIMIICTDDKNVMYAKKCEDTEFHMRDCFLYDKKKEEQKEIHFTDEEYLCFMPEAEYDDFLIGQMVYRDRQFCVQMKREDFYSGKLDVYHLILNNESAAGMSSAYEEVEGKKEDNDDDADKLVWVLADYSSSADINTPQLGTVTEEDWDYSRYSQVAQLLKQKGVSMDIVFKKLLIPMSDDVQLPDTSGVLQSLMEQGCHIDIISYTDEPLSCLMDLSDYLNTDTGRKVKEAVSEGVWEGLGSTDGKQYFIPKIKVLQGQQNGYVIDKTLLEESGLGQTDFQKDLKGLTASFDKVKNKGFSCYGLGPQIYSGIVYPLFTTLGDNLAINFLVIDRRKKDALVENIYENEECIQGLRTLQNWKQQGIFYSSEKDSLLLDDVYSKDNWYGDTKIMIPVGDSYAEQNIRAKSWAIYKNSKYADEAFEVLALSVTDSEVSMAVNPYQTNIVASEKELKRYDSFGFYPDMKPIQQEYNECIQIITERLNQSNNEKTKEKNAAYGDMWHGEMADLDMGLKELNAELRAAGLDKILTELNRQLIEFYNSKK